MRGEWLEHARCAGRDDIDWFPELDDAESDEEADELAAPAKALCHVCPVMFECRVWAIESREEYGIWGGLDEYERGRRRPRRRGAQTSVNGRVRRSGSVQPSCPGCLSADAVVPADASHLSCLDCGIDWPAPLR